MRKLVNKSLFFSSFIKFMNFSPENMTRTMPEEEKLLMMDEDLKNFYKAAFDDFDWNGNGRIATGVSKAGLKKNLEAIMYHFL